VNEEREQPRRRASLLRLFAAALAGAFGAFGVPAGGHAGGTASQAAVPPPANAADAPRPTLN